MLNESDKAPDFEMSDDSGKTVRLSDLKGKTVVLYFYPKDDTPGCTKEACAFRDNYSALKKQALLFGVSMDDADSHQAFRKKFSLPFPLLVDKDAVVSKAYGVYQQKNMYGRKFWGIIRSTFVIGPDGKLVAVFPRVKVDGHHLEVMEALQR
jgi:thioredoxin-dependent peroxiredoxin